MRAVPPEPSNPIRIGARIRHVRTSQGLTLAQVAERSGLTKGFLSRVERDDTSPSVASLVQLCQVLSIDVGSLFAEPDVYRVALDEAPLINMGGRNVRERLVSARRESSVQVIRSLMGVDATGGAELYTVASEVAVMHVHSGTVTVRFVDREHELQAGDTLTYPGREPHSWDSATGADVTWVLAPASWSGAS